MDGPAVWLASGGMRRLRLLPDALGVRPVAAIAEAEAAVGWGRRASWGRAVAAGAEAGKPAWAAEDGFIRSLGLGVAGAEPFGFCLDRTGIAFDASAPNDLETLILAGEVDPAAAGLRARVVAERIDKYGTEGPAQVRPAGRGRRILLVDQTAGDRSLSLGGADADTFRRMAEEAQRTGAEILVKVHPDVVAGSRTGCLYPALIPAGAQVVAVPCNPYALLAEVDEVWVATSQLGFEALLAGLPVTCFAAPWYAGWGATTDVGAIPDRRRRTRSLDALFTAAYLRYSRYADPVLGGPCGLERVLDRIADHRRATAGNRGRWWLVGLSMRKRRLLPAFLEGGTVACAEPDSIRLDARPGDRIAAWGVALDAEVRAIAADTGAAAVRIEDGFLRSVGLGSDLVRPGSLVFDDLGIYFDPRTPSRLEAILAEHPFSAAELERGAALAALLRATGITKYNTGAGRLVLPRRAAGRRTVLVPGQVEDDASIRTGTVEAVRTNRALLAAVRSLEPGAFLVYKPHPDVLAGHRIGAVPEASRLADMVVVDAPMDACLHAVDAVHTMTSLTGFEALVHGKAVTCHGTPFYAGWGLTEDRAPAPRRGRPLTLAALVHATLVLYPRYLDWDSGWFTGPEAMVELLRRRRAAAPAEAAAQMPRWRRLLGMLGRVLPRR